MIRLILILCSLASAVTRTHQDLIDLVGRKGDITHLYDLYKRAPWVNPTEYGAKCDGSTDDTQEIADAIASGFPVLFVSGTCLVSSALTFSQGAEFLPGAILKWTGTGYAISFDHIVAGPAQIFDCPKANPPTLTNAKTWSAKWFSALKYAFAALQTGQAMFLPNGDYMVDSTLDLSGKSFLRIEGETEKGVRIIPSGTVSGALIKFDNTEPTTQRKIDLKWLTFFSSSSYGIADYAIYAKWTPEFFMESCHFVNVSKIYSVYLNTTFVVTLLNCNGIGNVAHPSWGSAAPNAQSGGMGLYAENTSTTIKLITCRWQYYTVGVKFNGVDVGTLDNCAIESNTIAGVQLGGGGVDNVILNSYFEGHGDSARADIDFIGTTFSTVISGNYLHGAWRGIRFRSAVTVAGAQIQGNHFFSGNTAIEDSGSYLGNLTVSGNTFRDFATTLSMAHELTESRRRVVFRENYFGNSPEVPGDAVLLSFEGLGGYSATGTATVTASALRTRNDSVWRVTGTGVDYAGKSLFTISSTLNPNLRGKWVTVSVPVLGNVAGSPILEVRDGVDNKSFTMTAGTTWRMATVYKKLDAAATDLTLRFLPAGDTLYTGRPDVRLGFWDGGRP